MIELSHVQEKHRNVQRAVVERALMIVCVEPQLPTSSDASHKITFRPRRVR
jgi:hypothetical protein